jgi:hypothetical protein
MKISAFILIFLAFCFGVFSRWAQFGWLKTPQQRKLMLIPMFVILVILLLGAFNVI